MFGLVFITETGEKGVILRDGFVHTYVEVVLANLVGRINQIVIPICQVWGVWLREQRHQIGSRLIDGARRNNIGRGPSSINRHTAKPSRVIPAGANLLGNLGIEDLALVGRLATAVEHGIDGIHRSEQTCCVCEVDGGGRQLVCKIAS